MRTRKTYVDLLAPFLLAAFFLTSWLSWQTAHRIERERAVYEIGLSLPSGEITSDLLLLMEQFPGFCGYQAMYCLDAEVRIGTYRAPAQIRGVEMADYPLTVVKSAGEKKLGAKPLLIVGEGFLETLTDAGGHAITQRQAQIIGQEAQTQRVSLAFSDGGAFGERQMEAELLGFAAQDGVYMDAGQMKSWLSSLGYHCPVERAQLQIRGRKNSQDAFESLQNAGFEAEYVTS